MRVLLDANIFISFLLTPHSAGPIPSILEAAYASKFTMLVSDELLEEVRQSIRKKPYLNKRINPEQTSLLFRGLLANAEMLPPFSSSGEAPITTRDPKDDYLLAYAVMGRADWLVTGDEDLLVLDGAAGLRIVNPADFAETLSQIP